MIASVAIPIPIDRTFAYSVPEGLQDEISVGKRVRIRLNDRERWGIVISLSEGEDERLEPIISVRTEPAFSREGLAFCSYVCERYLAPLGILVNRILPDSVSPRRERILTLAAGLTDVTSYIERTSRRAPKQASLLRALLSSDGPQSESALRAKIGPVRKSIDRLIELGLIREVEPGPIRQPSRPEGFPERGAALLFGEERIEVYERLAGSALGEGRGGLLIAPEILAAEGLYRSLLTRFSGRIALYHSGLSEGERGRVWEGSRSGETTLIVGTRSALFLPLDRPGLIIVDEEQDRSYKQSEAIPYYNGRDIALKRGETGLIVLGSAAPSIESYHAARSGEIELIRLQDESACRSWLIIDYTGEEGISPRLADEIRSTLANRKGVLIGTGRAGYYPTVVCRTCRRPLRCRRCGTNLTYSPTSPRLICPFCGASERPHCEHCGDTQVEFIGSGSARIEAEVRELFPGAAVLRIDAESIGNRRDYRVVLREIEEADIVIGTPMIAKGPRIPNLGLVASVDIDRLLAIPDFRANERAYQYLIGLATRMEEGRVIVQTGRPDHPVIVAASKGNYEGFYRVEIEERRAFFYPPFSHLARITLPERDPRRWRAGVERITRDCAELPVEILGPVPHPGRGVNLILKARSRDILRRACLGIKRLDIGARIDIDPYRL